MGMPGLIETTVSLGTEALDYSTVEADLMNGHPYSRDTFRGDEGEVLL